MIAPTRDWVEWIKQTHPNVACEWVTEALESERAVLIPAADFLDVCKSLRSADEARFDFLHCITATDRKTSLEAVYHIYAFSRNERIILKVRVPRDAAEIPSVVELWPSADWHEREAYDLIGIFFRHHPDLRRILLPDDWEGHPLRKDYVQPEFYGEWQVPASDSDRVARPVN